VEIYKTYNFFVFCVMYDHTHLLFILSSIINIYHGFN
jgi:hypothetical protein